MDINITPNKLSGQFYIDGSKSFAHRAIISACLAKGITTIENVNFCDDVNATINCLRDLVKITKKDRKLVIEGGLKEFSKEKFFVDNSASTLRFLLPIISYFNKQKSVFVLGEQLANRIKQEIKANKIPKYFNFELVDNKLIVDSVVEENIYKFDLSITSQYATGFMFLAPFLAHDTTISLTNSKNSFQYIKLTTNVLKSFGIEEKLIGKNIFVINNQIYKPSIITSPSDASLALYTELMNKTGSSLVYDLYMYNENTPDQELVDRIGNDGFFDKDVIDFSNYPDAVIPCSIYSAFVSRHITTYTNISRLKFKESNRINSVVEMISSLGGKVEYLDDSLVFYPSKCVGGVVDSFFDHRIVLASILASTISKSNVYIKNIECLSKSTTNILSRFKNVGLLFDVVNTKTELNYTVNNKTTVIIQQNIIKEQNKTLFLSSKKYLLVTDNKIPEQLYKNLITSNMILFKLDDNGEGIKSMDYVLSIIDVLTKNNFSKSDELIAFGGGTITDLVGFVASIYKRGINYISIPTTILAQIDASIGGKVGINYSDIKNAIGSFYPPTTTYIDVNLTHSLDYNIKKQGMAELIKIAAISDVKLFYDLHDSEPYKKLNDWIIQAIKDKLEFVKIDPFDKNERRALNFGHTYGHVLEILEGLSHGEAVSLGMSTMSKNPDLIKTLIKYNLPTNTKRKKLYLDSYIKNDKKILNKTITKVYLNNIGDYVFKEESIWTL